MARTSPGTGLARRTAPIPAGLRVVALLSGGLDSSTLAYDLHDSGASTIALSFAYGQRHAIELDQAAWIAATLGIEHTVIDLTPLGISGSALTDPRIPVPDGHYTADSMKATVVPNRNALMLQIAVMIAVTRGFNAVAFAAHAGDHAIYPDCRPEWVEAFERAARLGNEGFIDRDFRVLAPYLGLDKARIVERGAELNVPFGATWSCYKGGASHCGTCGTCTERREAFALAGVADPTTYIPGSADAVGAA